MKPIVTVAAVDVRCPKCQEFLPNPNSGSLFFTIDEYVAGTKVTCNCCETVVTLPPLGRRVKVDN